MNKINQSLLLDFSPERAVAHTVQVSLESGSLDDFRTSWSEICSQVQTYIQRVSANPVVPQPVRISGAVPEPEVAHDDDNEKVLHYAPPSRVPDTPGDVDEMASVIKLIRENKIDRPRRGRKPKPVTQDSDPLNGFFDFYIICQNKKNFPNAVAKLPGEILSQHVDMGEVSVKFERMGSPVKVICLSHPDQVKAIKDRKDIAVVRTDNWFGPTDGPLTKTIHEARKEGMHVIYDTHFLRDWSRGFPVEAPKEMADAT